MRAAGSGQCIALKVQVLVVGRDSGIANFHPAILERPFGTRNPLKSLIHRSRPARDPFWDNKAHALAYVLVRAMSFGMCNRFRSVKDWSEIPRRLYDGPRLNFEFNPNVAPTELVPVFMARPDGPPVSRGDQDGCERQSGW